MSRSSKVEGNKIGKEISVLFIYSTNEVSTKEIQKTILHVLDLN